MFHTFFHQLALVLLAFLCRRFDHDNQAMSTQPNLPDPIDVRNPAHIQVWAAELRCRLDDVRAAVLACGPEAAAVREFVRNLQIGRR